jgi:hypothetical protein
MNPIDWIESHKTLTGMVSALFAWITASIYRTFRWKQRTDLRMDQHEKAIVQMQALADRIEANTKTYQLHHQDLMDKVQKEHGDRIDQIHLRVDDIYKLLVGRK